MELAPRHPRAASRPAATAPIDAAKLRELFDRYGNGSDGLISTPLLMHFVSLIGIERAAGVESLAQLYEEVVEDYLDRDYGRLDGKPTTAYAGVVCRSGRTNPAGRTKIKMAMARVALAILAAGGDTRLQPPDKRTPVEEVVDRLLGSPEDFRDPEWWSADPGGARGATTTRFSTSWLAGRCGSSRSCGATATPSDSCTTRSCTTSPPWRFAAARNPS